VPVTLLYRPAPVRQWMGGIGGEDRGQQHPCEPSENGAIPEPRRALAHVLRASWESKACTEADLRRPPT
jgi:hypothetical protein